MAEAVLETHAAPLVISAGKAYDSECIRRHIKDCGATPVIPSRSNATAKAYCLKRIYRLRHKVENFFCRLKDYRRIATRYDKTATNFLSAVALASTPLWVRQ